MGDVRQTRQWRTLRAAVLERDNYTCIACGGVANTADHRIPISKGGAPLDPENVDAMCSDCNTKKSDKLTGQLHDWINPVWLDWTNTQEITQ